MTGIQLILMFAVAIVLAGLSLLTFGRERGSGTIKFLGIEMTATYPLIAIALGSGLFLYAILNQEPFSACIVFCPSTSPSTKETVKTPPAPPEMPATRVQAFAIRKIGARSGIKADGCHDESKSFKITVPDYANLDTSYQGKLAGIEVHEGGNGTHENKNWAFADGGASLFSELYAKGGGNWVPGIGGGTCVGATPHGNAP